jgi:hypothetical protein
MPKLGLAGERLSPCVREAGTKEWEIVDDAAAKTTASNWRGVAKTEITMFLVARSK